MGSLDALDVSRQVRERLVDFSVDDRFTRDPRLGAISRAVWSGPAAEGGLVGDLWVEGAFPSKDAGSTLASLAAAGHFSGELQRVLDRPDRMPGDRALYTHQAAAIRAARRPREGGARPALVVTAGTGAGKTESFLLPLLDDLYTCRRGTEGGTRCLILYPMNALVNDQMDRLYSWLEDQARVTIFHFTGETPEDARIADRWGVPRWTAARFRTREQARGLEPREGTALTGAQRGAVPDIVITNYSMLEYMLCRPQDAAFFGPALRTIVLDEAHLYTGTLAAEITLLLRRLCLRCGRRPEDLLQIATSATLGRGNAEELRDFVSTIFSKPPRLIEVIGGEPREPDLAPEAPPIAPATPESFLALPWPEGALIVDDETGKQQLADDPEACARLREGALPAVVARHVIEAAGERHAPARLLRETLAASPLLHTLNAALYERRHLRLADLADRLWAGTGEAAMRATVVLLNMAASARSRAPDYPLLPHRIHLLARPSTGLHACLNPSCTGDPARRLPPLGLIQGEDADRCGACGMHTLPIWRCGTCGEWFLMGVERDGTLAAPSSLPDFVPTACYPLATRAGEAGQPFAVDPRSGTFAGAGGGGLHLRRVGACPHCGGEPEGWTACGSGVPLALTIVAETLLGALPEYAAPHRAILPARGRRLLAFSDSRQEAARLGPRLTRQHETQVVRAAIVRMLVASPLADEETIRDIQGSITGTRQELSGEDLTPAQRNRKQRRLEDLEQELREALVGGSIAEWARELAADREGVLAEVLSLEGSEKHQADDRADDGAALWSGEHWDTNARQVRAKAALLLGRELASPLRRRTNAETLGFAEITYPGIEGIDPPLALLGTLPREEVRQRLEAHWAELLAALCDTLRTDGAITLGSEEADEAYTFGSALLGRWSTRDQARGSARRLVRFVGESARQRRWRFAGAVLERCGATPTEATAAVPTLLGAAYDQLLERARGGTAGEGSLEWLERTDKQTKNGPSVDAIRIRFLALGLRQPRQVFRCRVTGHLWPRGVLDCAPETGSEGTLVAITAAQLDADPRVGRQRREYQHLEVFRIGLWADEHSAQLAPRENRRLQDLFKAGIRNILSATTTLELGIDIGGLNAVLMANVPPGKANYLQRAGRAGRRADGSSVVLTFARPRPYDLAVFADFGSYLGRELRRPTVFLDRERVVLRHFHSLLINTFFQDLTPPGARTGAMAAFGNMGVFCGREAAAKWDGPHKPPPPSPARYTIGHAGTLPWWRGSDEAASPADRFRAFLLWLQAGGESSLRGQAEDLFRGTICQRRTVEWAGVLAEAIAGLDLALASWRQEYEEVAAGWAATTEKAQANAMGYQMRALCDLTVIEALADRQFLPRYGFPIGLQRLQVLKPDEERPGKVVEEDKYRLERSGLLALREYVPGSQLLAGGKLVTSHGLRKHWTGATVDNYLGQRYDCYTCANKHFYYAPIGTKLACPICGAQPLQSASNLLFPKHGFTTAAWDPPTWSTDVERVGSVHTASLAFAHRATGGVPPVEEFAAVRGLRALYREDGELLVYNRGANDKGFAICLSCGYAESERDVERGSMRLPPGFESHAPVTSRNPYRACRGTGKESALRNHMLGARETTDVLLLECAGPLGPLGADEVAITTLGYALRRAGAQLLELDSREIGVMAQPTGNGSWGILLYDNVPGGAGHVRELLGDAPRGAADPGREWLVLARETLYVDAEHDARCEIACLRCLLAFDAQEAMTQQKLDRRLALGYLDAMLRGDSPPGGRGTGTSGQGEPDGPLRPVAQLTTEERRRRASQQQSRRR